MLRLENEKLALAIVLALSALMHLALLKLPLGLESNRQKQIMNVELCQLAGSRGCGNRRQLAPSKKANEIAGKAQSAHQVAAPLPQQGIHSPAAMTAAAADFSSPAEQGAGSPQAAVNPQSGLGADGADNPSAETAFGIGDGPRFKTQVLPEYPRRARLASAEGLVVLRLTIAATGRLLDAQVVQSASFGLTEAALRAARSSSYYPASRAGAAFESSVLLPVRFRLEH